MEDLVDYGPLKNLIGRWEGQKGVDVAPEPGDIETNSYREYLDFEAIGDLDNAQSQFLSVVTYRQRVFRISDGKRIHDQVGYWMWDSENELILHSYTIPRGVNVTCSGKAVHKPDGSIVLSVVADKDVNPQSISQSTFMTENANTSSFKMELVISAEGCLSYKQETMLDIYGQTFSHTDENTLKRV